MKSTLVTYLLWFFLGALAVHRFYLGRPLSAVLFILTLGGVGLWWLLDLFLIPGMVRTANLEQQLKQGTAAQTHIHVHNS